MLQQDKPDDYVVGTGESHSVREFVEAVFKYAGIELEWTGSGINTKGLIRSLLPTLNVEHRTLNLVAGDTLIEIDPRYFRPTEVDYLQADITKARKQLGWQPRVTFDELVKIMVDYDLKIVDIEPPGEGIEISKGKGFTYTNHDFSLYEKIREGC
jgi:GDPmannose 4,6-dehydratase